ncbi:MAG TPA: hypothetical protein PLO51_04615, partial [Candidatus Micrarchaeota archaeon]|nr:hypothetical protein [Candidatus Micrarchaeota archaeon]
MDSEFFARYPFLPQSKEYVIARKLELTPEFVEAGYKRAQSAIVDGKIAMFTKGMVSAYDSEIASYSACRMMVSLLNSSYFSNRLAVAESKRASAYLEREKDPDLLMAAQSMGIDAAAANGAFQVGMADYLRYTPRDVHYKLVNANLVKGKVASLTREKLIRIIEEAVKKRVIAGLGAKGEYPSLVKEYSKKLSQILPKAEQGVIQIASENYPPCIKKLLSDLAVSENLPHSARVALAIYLIKAGVEDGKIVKLFSTAPDFNEGTTKYQVEYIRKKEYSMPSCATMDSWGICVATCRCFSPLRFNPKIHGR